MFQFLGCFLPIFDFESIHREELNGLLVVWIQCRVKERNVMSVRVLDHCWHQLGSNAFPSTRGLNCYVFKPKFSLRRMDKGGWLSEDEAYKFAIYLCHVACSGSMVVIEVFWSNPWLDRVLLACFFQISKVFLHDDSLYFLDCPVIPCRQLSYSDHSTGARYQVSQRELAALIKRDIGALSPCQRRGLSPPLRVFSE